MKTLITFLLLISTPLMAQTYDRAGRLCPKDPYAVGRPTVEELQRRFTTKTVPAVEQQTCRTIEAVRVASEGGDVQVNEQFTASFIAITLRIQALEEHVASETSRIDSSLQNINTRLVELNSRPAYIKPAQQYTPPSVPVDYGTAPSQEPVKKSNRWDNAENNLK